MKATISLLLMVPLTASAFTPSLSLFQRQPTFLSAAKDSSAAVAAALEASKKYGATSPEARVAWEAVEDMDSSDNR